MSSLKIESVTTCIGYGDFLAQTLPENKPLLDNIIVITSPQDEETRAVCRKYNVHHILTDDHKRGGPFNKARLINRAFDQIGGKEWILHLDADMVLPSTFRELVEWAHPHPDCIYGADRQRVVGWDAWNSFRQHVGRWGNHVHENQHWFHPKFPLMSRWVSAIHGYTPIGAFQFFHGSALVEGGYHKRRYPIAHGDAARSDVQFALQWDRQDRVLLPEIVCLHLESEPGQVGVNWAGRKTKRFGPPLSPVPSPKPVS